MDPFVSKVGVVTGAARGIGYNVAKELVARGAYVVIGDLLDKQGEAAAKEFNDRAGKQVAVYLHTDVTKYKDLIALFALAEKTFGSVDIAVLNAGITGPTACGIFTPLDDEKDMFIHEVNMGGVIKGDKVAILHMAKHGRGGVIVNTASMAGVTPSSYIASYCASKHAVVGWTRSLSHLKHVCNVRVNAVCPAVCPTEINDNVESQSASEFLKSSPQVPMEVVVQTFMRCIEDTRLSGDILLALPDGTHVQPKYIPPASSISKEFLEKLPQIRKSGNMNDKESLAQAIKNAKL
ncbi:hypothetical protein BDA99DRAFT_502214 [Phascolomyces articulosus]|uniref:Uncharacterized protein n=1 Tax=Phascolomyces articulosus TaxID=60185 RepID=A0AAD5KH37_9FUNG|nr:hypothetical protein BDA99DRAFT_502214 [Phascolomyces articulosus]